MRRPEKMDEQGQWQSESEPRIGEGQHDQPTRSRKGARWLRIQSRACAAISRNLAASHRAPPQASCISSRPGPWLKVAVPPVRSRNDRNPPPLNDATSSREKPASATRLTSV